MKNNIIFSWYNRLMSLCICPYTSPTFFFSVFRFTRGNICFHPVCICCCCLPPSCRHRIPHYFFFCFFCCFFLLAPFLLCKPSLCGGTCTSCSNIDLWRRTGACDFSVGCCRRRETNTSTGEAAGSEKLYVLICDSRAGSPSGTREFLYVFFLPIFFITCVCPVSSNVALWIQKSISLAALLLSVQLILCPAIQPFYSLDVFSLLLPLHFCALFFVPRSN